MPAFFMRSILLFTYFLLVCVACRKPKACIQADKTFADLGEPVTFIDCSEHAENHAYNFGDGSNWFSRDPVHSFEKPGIYQVTVTVSDKREKRETAASININIDGVVPGDFTVSRWELYKTSRKFISTGNEDQVETPAHEYRFASDSVYVFDGFSDPLPLKFTLLNDHQFMMDTVKYNVIYNYSNELHFRTTEEVGAYRVYYLKKI